MSRNYIPESFNITTWELLMPYYEKAKKGTFDPEKGKVEYKQLLDKLVKATEDVDMTQTEFQRLVGKIEVVGELIIKSKEFQKK
jgi:hypothetical protein